MMQNQNGNTPRYPRRNAAEDRVWRRLYRSAGNPVAVRLDSGAAGQRQGSKGDGGDVSGHAVIIGERDERFRNGREAAMGPA